MDNKEFKSELIKSYNQLFKIGLILFLICGLITLSILIFMGLSERTAIAGLSIFGLFVFIGATMMISSLMIKQKIKTDRHELLIAIRNNDNFLVWIYEHIMTTQHELSNKQHKNYMVTAYKKDGKILKFMLKEQSKVHDMIEYLSSEFPNALTGFTEENRIEAGKVLGQDIKKTFF